LPIRGRNYYFFFLARAFSRPLISGGRDWGASPGRYWTPAAGICDQQGGGGRASGGFLISLEVPQPAGPIGPWAGESLGAVWRIENVWIGERGGPPIEKNPTNAWCHSGVRAIFWRTRNFRVGRRLLALIAGPRCSDFARERVLTGKALFSALAKKPGFSPTRRPHPLLLPGGRGPGARTGNRRFYGRSWWGQVRCARARRKSSNSSKQEPGHFCCKSPFSEFDVSLRFAGCVSRWPVRRARKTRRGEKGRFFRGGAPVYRELPASR